MPKLRHIASPPYAAWTYGTQLGENCVTLRHRLMPLGLTSNWPADPLFQAGTNDVTPAWRQVRLSVAARGPVCPRPLAVAITENCPFSWPLYYLAWPSEKAASNSRPADLKPIFSLTNRAASAAPYSRSMP